MLPFEAGVARREGNEIPKPQLAFQDLHVVVLTFRVLAACAA